MSMKPLVDTHHDGYAWMQNSCYEPPRPRHLRSREWLGPVLLILGIIAAVTGGLIAWSMTQ